MKKCDFCIKSDPNGKYSWSTQYLRENDCEQAIKRMEKVLKGNTVSKGER